MDTKKPYRERVSIQQRTAETANVRLRHPGKFPIIVERSLRAVAGTPTLVKCKYIVPGDITIAQFLMILRKNLKMDSSQGLFMFVGDLRLLPRANASVSEVYSEHASGDGLLYMEYTLESTFGRAYLFLNPL